MMRRLTTARKPQWRGRWVAAASAALVLGVAIGVAGCAETPAETSVPSAPAKPTASASPSASPSVSPTPSSKWQLGPNGECDAGQLEMALDSRPEDSGAGQFYWNLSFTNTSEIECTLTGPPSIVSLVDAGTGQLIGAPVGTEDPSGLGNQTVLMAPGSTAISILHLGQAGAYTCPIVRVNQLAVSPPDWDATTLVNTPNEIDGCNDPSVQLVRASPISTTGAVG